MKYFLMFALIFPAFPGCAPEEDSGSSNGNEAGSPFEGSGGVRGIPGQVPGSIPEGLTGGAGSEFDDEVPGTTDGQTDIDSFAPDASSEPTSESLNDVTSASEREKPCEPPCANGDCVDGVCVSPCDNCPEGSVCDENGICINPLFLVCESSAGEYVGSFDGTLVFDVKEGSRTGLSFPSQTTTGAILLQLECSDLDGIVEGEFSGQFGIPASLFTFTLKGEVDFEKGEMSWELSEGTVTFGSSQLSYQASGSGVSTGNNGTQWEGTWELAGDPVVSRSQPLSGEMKPMAGSGTWIMGIEPPPEE